MPTCTPFYHRRSGRWGSYSFVDGFTARQQETSVWEEARRGQDAAEAVINRLIRQGEWELAEQIMDLHIQ